MLSRTAFQYIVKVCGHALQNKDISITSESLCTQEKTMSSSDRSRSFLEERRSVQLKDLNSWAPGECCKKQCASAIGHEELRMLRGKFLESKRDGRKMMLKDFLYTRPDGPPRFCIRGVQPCHRLITSAFDISNQMVSSVLGRPSANASSLPGRQGGTDISSTMKSAVIAFLKSLADDIADEIPNSSDRHLPHGNKLLVYSLYQENERRYGCRSCKTAHFYSVWKEFCPLIKCRKRHGFSLCDQCTSFKEKLLSLARQPGFDAERKELKNDFRSHLKFIQ